MTILNVRDANSGNFVAIDLEAPVGIVYVNDYNNSSIIPVNMGGGLIFGSLFGDDISQVITIASGNVYYKVTASLSSGICHGFTFQNNSELVCTVAGVYGTSWNMSLTSATANESVSGTIMINNTEVHAAEADGDSINVNRQVSVGGGTAVSLNVGDRVGLAVQNESGAHNITVRHANLFLWRLGTIT